MRSALLAALLLAAAAAASGSSTEEADGGGDGVEAEEDTDVAPFTVVVEHSDGWRCSGSLVSLRMVLTSARCAGAAGAAELWARAPAHDAARRVIRLLLALPHFSVLVQVTRVDADLCVAELESAFEGGGGGGGGARAQPILVATSAHECAGPRPCHVVALRAGGGPGRPRLRIEDAHLAGPADSACQGPAPLARAHSLCLTGVTLCGSAWGAGVVCGGKLCGVVSGLAAGARPVERARRECGDVTTVAGVARSRRFLRCAYAPHACKPGGECADLCTEVRLGMPEAPAPPTRSVPPAPRTAPPALLDTRSGPPAPRTPAPHITAGAKNARTKSMKPHSGSGSGSGPGPGAGAGGVKGAAARGGEGGGAEDAAPPPSPRLAFEFEPNRADFKAGEYGDVAEYGAGSEEGGGGAGMPTRSPAPAAPEARTAPAAREPSVEAARVSPAGALSRAAHPPARVAALIYILCLLI